MNRKTEPKKSPRSSQKTSNSSRPVRSSQMSADERIVNRTNTRRRKNQRKKLIIRAVLGSAFLIAAIILVLIMFFNINKITVTGDIVYSEEEIVSASGVKIGDNLIFISGKKINQILSEKLPYIGEVKIKRHLPATLEIIVTKTTATYAVYTEGAYALLDCNGKVLEKGLEFVAENITILNLGNITSAELGKVITLQEQQIFDKFLLIDNACKQCGISGISSEDLSDVYNIKLVYQGRITLKLGDINDKEIYSQLSLAKDVLENQDKENDAYVGELDLRVSKQAVWREETVTEESTTEEPLTDENGEVISEENSTENAEETTSVAA